MANYVLVHGAWSGPQCWDAVAAALKDAGHTVLVPALPGLGTRHAEMHGGITLTDHVDAVSEQIAEAGFDRFIIAGHSYAGMIITAIASRMGRSIDGICYVDAFWHDDGSSLWELTDEFTHNWYINSQRSRPGYVSPVASVDFEPVPGVVDYHPLLTFLEAIPLSGEEKLIPRKSYILATNFNLTPFPPFAEKAKAAGWEVHEAHCGHFVMKKEPELTVRVLLGLGE